MSTSVNHPVQSLSVWKKSPKKLKLAEQCTKADKSQNRDFDIENNLKDIVEIKSPVWRSIKSDQDSGENSPENTDEARVLLEELVGLLNSESEKSRLQQVHDFNPQNLVDLLS